MARPRKIRARLQDRIRTALDSSGMSLELLDLAQRFAAYRCSAHRRAARSESGSACDIPSADVEDIAADALTRFTDKLAEEGDFPQDFRTVRAWMSSAVRFAVADYMRDRFASLRLGERADLDPDDIGQEPENIDHEEEYRRALERIRQLPQETRPVAVAIACTQSLTDAAHAASVSRSTLYRHLGAMRESVETEIGGLYRTICEALEQVRTGEECLLPSGLKITARYR